MTRLVLLFSFFLAACTPSSHRNTTQTPTERPVIQGGDAHVEFVRVEQTAANTYTFHVTVRHLDTGRDDYADGWNVVLPDGQIVRAAGDESPFTRLLLHPHENEQPFTRSQSGLVISAEIQSVTVRAHDSVDGFGGREVVVDMTATTGDGFSIAR